uniref:hypothetical protein n=1 Tax=Yersinia intermedia TaxID=631 RepID=UPI00119EC8A5
MEFFEWEQMDKLGEYYDTLSFSDIIHDNITSFEIQRDENFNIIMECLYKNHDNRQVRNERKPLGTVEYITSEAIFKSSYDSKPLLNLSGISQSNTHIEYVRNESAGCVSSYTIHKLAVSIDPSLEPYYIIDWVLNLDLGSYVWPETTSTDSKEEITTTIGSNNPVIFSSESFNGGGSKSCCSISICGIDIYFGKATNSGIDEKFSPGYIIYKKKPSDNFSQEIINALSFMVGRKVIYIGNIILNEQKKVVSKEFISPNTMNGLFLNSPPQPPCKLMNESSKYFLSDSKVIEKFLSNFIENYNKYDIEHVLWLYYHATIAPVHLQAVCFGAVLEFLQKMFIQENKTNFSSTLIPKDEWKKISTLLKSSILSIKELDEEAYAVFNNKISNLNMTPQSILTSRFFDIIDIKLGDIEKKSYSRRNDAAHGNKTPNNDYISLIRDNKILRVLC